MKSHDGNHPKILCVSVMQSWGGGEEFILKLHKNLARFEFIVVTPEGKVEQKFRGNGIRTIINNNQKKIYRDSGWDLKDYINIIFGIKLSTFKFLRIFRQEKPSLILANGLFAGLFVLPAVMLTRRKQITIQHLIFENNSIEKKIVRLLLKFTDKIVCVSNAVKENIYSMIKTSSPGKLVTIPNGIRIPESPFTKFEPGSIVKFGMTGSIIRIKGIHLVIEAMREIMKNRNAIFYIYGEAGVNEDSLRYKSELKKMIADYALEEKIRFEGYIESKGKLYSSIDILINFSIIPESFSYSVLEAMAYKKIVIAANSGGPKEFIQDGVNGFLAEMQNTNELKDKMSYCLDNLGTDEFYRIRNRAFDTVKNNYTIEKFIDGYTTLFDDLINKRN